MEKTYTVSVRMGKTLFHEEYKSYGVAVAYFLRREDFVWNILINEEKTENPPTPDQLAEPVEITLKDNEGNIYFYSKITL